MTTRRGTGEGGVRKRADGRWEGSLDVGYGPGGKRLRKYVYARSKADVLQRLQAERQRLTHGLPPTDARLRFEAFLTWWAATVLPGTVSRGSEETYRRHVELYLIPALGRIRLAELSPANVTEMMRRMQSGELSARQKPLSAQTQGQARKVLAKALRRPEQEGLVHRNVARLVDGPRTARREPRSLTLDQARVLLSAVATHRLGAAFSLQLTLGLRRGELLGLCWTDADLGEEPGVRIRRQLQRRPGVGLELVELKTHQSRRDLDLPEPVAAALRSWRATQAAERLAAGPVWSDSEGLVFTTALGTPVDPDNYRRRFAEATSAAGLGHWRTHELRHTAASILFAEGVPMKLISESLGHSSERVTADVYVHTERAHRSKVAAVMASALYSAAGDPETTGGQPGGHRAPQPSITGL